MTLDEVKTDTAAQSNRQIRHFNTRHGQCRDTFSATSQAEVFVCRTFNPTRLAETDRFARLPSSRRGAAQFLALQ
jgi:hypothetical protein